MAVLKPCVDCVAAGDWTPGYWDGIRCPKHKQAKQREYDANRPNKAERARRNKIKRNIKKWNEDNG